MTALEAEGAVGAESRRTCVNSRVNLGVNLRVGVDLVTIADIEGSMRRYGDRYTRRLFTDRELADTAGSAQAARLAARFAAKEATIKALEPDLEPPGWRSIEILRSGGGRCALALHGRAARLAEAAGVDEWVLSMSHEGPVAVAVVIGCARLDEVVTWTTR